MEYYDECMVESNLRKVAIKKSRLILKKCDSLDDFIKLLDLSYDYDFTIDFDDIDNYKYYIIEILIDIIIDIEKTTYETYLNMIYSNDYVMKIIKEFFNDMQYGQILIKKCKDINIVMEKLIDIDSYILEQIYQLVYDQTQNINIINRNYDELIFLTSIKYINLNNDVVNNSEKNTVFFNILRNSQEHVVHPYLDELIGYFYLTYYDRLYASEDKCNNILEILNCENLNHTNRYYLNNINKIVHTNYLTYNQRNKKILQDSLFVPICLIEIIHEYI